MVTKLFIIPGVTRIGAIRRIVIQIPWAAHTRMVMCARHRPNVLIRIIGIVSIITFGRERPSSAITYIRFFFKIYSNRVVF